MHTTQEILLAAGSLSNLLRAGLPMDQSLERLMDQVPARADFWSSAARRAANGYSFSETLKGEWPEGLVSAVQAGEESGELVRVFEQIEETINTRNEIWSHAKKLGYPLGLVVGGIVLFIGFMVVVLPSMARGMSVKSPSPILNLAFWMEGTVMNFGIGILAGAIGLVVYAITWLRTEQGKQAVLTFFLGIPVIGDALTEMFFGIWAHYMSLMSMAGIDTIRSFEMTAPVLPEILRPAILAVHEDLLANRSLAEATDPALQPDGDPRKIIPFYIAVAMKIANETGAIDKELKKVAAPLIKDAVRTMNQGLRVAGIVAMAIAAAAIMTPLGALYMTLFSSIRSIG